MNKNEYYKICLLGHPNDHTPDRNEAIDIAEQMSRKNGLPTSVVKDGIAIVVFRPNEWTAADEYRVTEDQTEETTTTRFRFYAKPQGSWDTVRSYLCDGEIIDFQGDGTTAGSVFDTDVSRALTTDDREQARRVAERYGCYFEELLVEKQKLENEDLTDQTPIVINSEYYGERALYSDLNCAEIELREMFPEVSLRQRLDGQIEDHEGHLIGYNREVSDWSESF